MMKGQITLVGCGRIGLPLAQKLTALGHNLIATKSTLKNEEVDQGFKIFPFDITSERPDPSLLQSEIIIYTIPPLGQGEVESFFKDINENRKIIFLSSTSVYGKNQGEVNESSSFDPLSKNALVLKEAESFLKKRFKNLTIVRPGGLYDNESHPVNFLAGKSGITSGSEFLHLVHREDVVIAISEIIERHLIGEDFNLVNDLRVLKKDYYVEKAKKLNLPVPQFTDNPLSNPTKISNAKSKKLLGMHYKIEDTF